MQDKQTEQYNNYIEQIESELQNTKTDYNKLANAQLSLFGSSQEDNLIKWQLDLNEDKERIHHLLRGDAIEEDDEGNIVYVHPKDIKKIPFNDYGVSMVMQIINYYLNKNTILSNYDEQTINWKVHDFGLNLVDYIHNNYQELFRLPTFKEAKAILLERIRNRHAEIKEVCKDFFGAEPKEEVLKDKVLLERGYKNITDEIRAIQKEYCDEKAKMTPLIVEAIVNTVHSAYLRAFRGGERESLRTARTVTQNEPLMQNFPQPTAAIGRKFSLLKPTTWKV